jgi:tetratricopeptide (TPR) repeat protein
MNDSTQQFEDMRQLYETVARREDPTAVVVAAYSEKEVTALTEKYEAEGYHLIDANAFGEFINDKGREILVFSKQDTTFQKARRLLFDEDYEQAEKLFRQVALTGHAEAFTYLGYMHRKGLGMRRDDAVAAEFYQTAIDIGGETLLSSTAYNNLGVLYQKGEGVKQDLKKARELFSKAIEMDGSELSQRHLEEIRNMNNTCYKTP